jgi:hypothetical protein
MVARDRRARVRRKPHFSHDNNIALRAIRAEPARATIKAPSPRQAEE